MDNKENENEKIDLVNYRDEYGYSIATRKMIWNLKMKLLKIKHANNGQYTQTV